MLTLGEKGGRGGLDSPFLADIICEQPLTIVQTLITTLFALCILTI